MVEAMAQRHVASGEAQHFYMGDDLLAEGHDGYMRDTSSDFGFPTGGDGQEFGLTDFGGRKRVTEACDEEQGFALNDPLQQDAFVQGIGMDSDGEVAGRSRALSACTSGRMCRAWALTWAAADRRLVGRA